MISANQEDTVWKWQWDIRNSDFFFFSFSKQSFSVALESALYKKIHRELYPVLIFLLRTYHYMASCIFSFILFTKRFMFLGASTSTLLHFSRSQILEPYLILCKGSSSLVEN